MTTPQPSQMKIGIVIRKDGTVPFDPDVLPHVRGQMIAHLIDLGHELETIPGTNHVRIKNWAANKAKIDAAAKG